MKLTNNFCLPQPIYDAIANDPYSKGDADYSVTGLLRPPRIPALERLHYGEISEDASDRIFSLLGQVIHGILERAEVIGVAEKRLYVQIGGKRLSGQMDRVVYMDKLLQDYKLTSVFKTLGGKVPIEWIEQQNCYRYLLAENGYAVDNLQVVAIYRDWKKRSARTEENYPVAQTETIAIPVWPHEKTRDFILERIRLHEAAKIELPLCTAEDRWAEPDRFAVVKPGAKRAAAVYPSMELAESHRLAMKNPDDYLTQHRRGQNKRCEDYCRVAQFCTQWKSLNEKVSAVPDGEAV